MEFWTSVKVILRRWYVVIPCLMLTCVVGLYLVKHVRSTYQASGSVLLSGSGHASRPETASTVAGVNPYANMDQGQLAFLVSQSAGSTAFQEEMTQAGAVGTYSVTAIPAEPAMTVTLSAPSPEQAMSSYRKLVSLLDSQIALKQRAVGAPADTLVGVQSWISPSSAVAVNAAKVKALILVLVIGLLLTLSLAFLVDALLTNGAPWSRSSEEEPDEADAATDELPTGPVAVPAHIELDDLDDVNLDEVDDDDGRTWPPTCTDRRCGRSRAMTWCNRGWPSAAAGRWPRRTSGGRVCRRGCPPRAAPAPRGADRSRGCPGADPPARCGSSGRARSSLASGAAATWCRCSRSSSSSPSPSRRR